MPTNRITDLMGIRVGHAQNLRLASGVTALVFDAPVVAGVDVRGGGPGTRETDLLDPERTVERIDALVLSGGSVFGLDAAASCLPRTNDADRLAPVRARMREQALALGWRLDASDPLGGLRVIADGTMIEPVMDGLNVRFVVPAEAAEVWLVSGSSVPWEVSGAGDARRLGACISGLSIDDGLAPRRMIDLDDPTLQDGFHPAQAHGLGHLRWTDGLGCPRISGRSAGACSSCGSISRACLPAWQAPAAILSAAAEAGGHLRALR